MLVGLQVYLESFSPQFPQNLVSGGFFVLHFVHVISVSVVDFDRDFPQFPQNFMPTGFSALQFGHAAFGVGAKLTPQFPQNFIPAVFFALHFWQITTS